MLKVLIFIAVVWLLARLAKRWLLGKAQQMQRNLEAQLRAQMGGQMGSQMGQGMGQNMGGDQAHSHAAAAQNASSAADGAERMLACAQCGLHIPQSEALMRAGQPYCSPAHANQAQA